MSTVLKSANTEQKYSISKKDLPLSCPSKDMQIWNSHPRVFLPVEESGEARCPYCGAHYVLTD